MDSLKWEDKSCTKSVQAAWCFSTHVSYFVMKLAAFKCLSFGIMLVLNLEKNYIYVVMKV